MINALVQLIKLSSADSSALSRQLEMYIRKTVFTFSVCTLWLEIIMPFVFDVKLYFF